MEFKFSARSLERFLGCKVLVPYSKHISEENFVYLCAAENLSGRDNYLKQGSIIRKKFCEYFEVVLQIFFLVNICSG